MNAIRKSRPAMVPGLAVSKDRKIVRLRPRPVRPVLASCWRRQADGRLTCIWQRVASLPCLYLHGAVTDGDEHRP